MREPSRLVIRDRDAWRDAWQRVNSTVLPPPLPEIDFSREMVVLVALGARPSGGYDIVVDSAYERADRLEIIVRSQSPGKSCAVTLALTQPVDIVRLPKTALPVVFHETEIVHECK